MRGRVEASALARPRGGVDQPAHHFGIVRENVHPNAEAAQLNGKLDYRLDEVKVARIGSNPGACSLSVCEGLDPLADAVDHDLLPVLVVIGVHQSAKRLRRTRPAAPEDGRGSSRGMG